MFKVTLTKDWSCTQAGKTYYMDRVNAAQVLIGQEAKAIGPLQYEPPGKDGTLLVRPGGFGDLIHLHPTIVELKKDTDNLDLCVHPKFADCFKHHPLVRNVISYPLEEHEADRYSRIVWMEGSVEDNTTDHMADAFLKHAGYDPESISKEDKRPRLYLSPNRKPRKKHKVGRVGFQLKASARCRTPHPKQMATVIEHFIREGWEVEVYGAPNEISLDVKEVKNWTQHNPPLSFLKSCELVEDCDLFIAPDSGLLHAAGALGVPSVGLYGPFPADLRIRHTPRCIAIQGTAPCAPCFWHARGAHFPTNCPTAKTGFCGVLTSIEPEKIIAAAYKVLQK